MSGAEAAGFAWRILQLSAWFVFVVLRGFLLVLYWVYIGWWWHWIFYRRVRYGRR